MSAHVPGGILGLPAPRARDTRALINHKKSRGFLLKRSIPLFLYTKNQFAAQAESADEPGGAGGYRSTHYIATVRTTATGEFVEFFHLTTRPRRPKIAGMTRKLKHWRSYPYEFLATAETLQEKREAGLPEEVRLGPFREDKAKSLRRLFYVWRHRLWESAQHKDLGGGNDGEAAAIHGIVDELTISLEETPDGFYLNINHNDAIDIIRRSLDRERALIDAAYAEKEAGDG